MRFSLIITTLFYRLNEETGIIDYDRMDENAKLFRPKLIVAGASAYAKLIDYKRMRDICDRNGAWLLSDMAHISGSLSYKFLTVHSDICCSEVMRVDY
jgi:glycine hydroxymethyltransferase